MGAPQTITAHGDNVGGKVLGAEMLGPRFRRDPGRQHSRLYLQFHVSKQGAEFGRGQSPTLGDALLELGVTWQRLNLSGKPLPLQRRQHPAMYRCHLGCLGGGHRQQGVLRPIVGQHSVGDIGRQRLQQNCALVPIHGAGGDRIVERDLDVDFVIGGIDARDVVDRIRVQACAVQCRLAPAPAG